MKKINFKRIIEDIAFVTLLISMSGSAESIESGNLLDLVISLVLFFVSIVVLILEVNTDEEILGDINRCNDASYPSFLRK